MLVQVFGGVTIALGLFMTSAAAPELVSGLLSDDTCRAATQYDSQNNNIRECKPKPCDDDDNKCERRSYTYLEDGLTVTIVYCSCEELSGTGEPSGVCHVYRKHKGATTIPYCTDGTNCPADKKCGFDLVPGSWPWIHFCDCGGLRPPHRN